MPRREREGERERERERGRRRERDLRTDNGGPEVFLMRNRPDRPRRGRRRNHMDGSRPGRLLPGLLRIPHGRDERDGENGTIVRERVAGATTRIGLQARATLSPVAHTMWLRCGG